MPTGYRAAFTVLLTGFSSAGKTTLAQALVSRLHDLGRRAESLDGDVVRRALWPELGMSNEDRQQNLSRIDIVARLLAGNGVIAVVAAIAPLAEARQLMRYRHTEAGLELIEVHLATPLAECRRRDVKGLYAKQARGEIVGLTGVDAIYEPPEQPELRIDTSGEDVDRSTDHLIRFLTERNLLSG